MREMRRKDRELTREEGLEILDRGEFGTLATVDREGAPYAVPISYARDGNAIYMHVTSDGGQKVENIRANDRVCFNVVSMTELQPDRFGTKYLSATAFGRAVIVEDEEEKRHGLMCLLHKYSAEFLSAGRKYIDAAIDRVHLIRIDVETITAKGKK